MASLSSIQPALQSSESTSPSSSFRKKFAVLLASAHPVTLERLKKLSSSAPSSRYTDRLAMDSHRNPDGTTSKFTVFVDQSSLDRCSIKIEDLKDANWTSCGIPTCTMAKDNQLCDTCRKISPLCLVGSAIYQGHKRFYDVPLEIDTSPHESEWTISAVASTQDTNFIDDNLTDDSQTNLPPS